MLISYAPDFRVAHEPIVQTDCVSVRKEGTIRMLFGDGIHVGGICCVDGITFHAFLWSDSPSVVNAIEIVVSEANALRVPLHYSHQTDLILNLGHGGD